MDMANGDREMLAESRHVAVLPCKVDTHLLQAEEAAQELEKVGTGHTKGSTPHLNIVRVGLLMP